ncbi:hypothetical protein RF11_13634 [Thelohanellus kitauei]|uniref:Uncharacterized protein n=1 Tax=Thelohanellus kitauei TaxID=669202 RepID=A0A0C2J0X3_THEKT|nr:hypothetical protein RF11_13634 [Thelohanellus kitauei]
MVSRAWDKNIWAIAILQLSTDMCDPIIGHFGFTGARLIGRRFGSGMFMTEIRKSFDGLSTQDLYQHLPSYHHESVNGRSQKSWLSWRQRSQEIKAKPARGYKGSFKDSIAHDAAMLCLATSAMLCGFWFLRLIWHVKPNQRARRGADVQLLATNANIPYCFLAYELRWPIWLRKTSILVENSDSTNTGSTVRDAHQASKADERLVVLERLTCKGVQATRHEVGLAVKARLCCYNYSGMPYRIQNLKCQKEERRTQHNFYSGLTGPGLGFDGVWIFLQILWLLAAKSQNRLAPRTRAAWRRLKTGADLLVYFKR